MESKVKQSKSDTGNLGKTNSKKSRKSEKENALEQELRAKIAKLEGENVLLHERNVDVTKELAESKKNLEESQLSLSAAKESILQLTLQKHVTIFAGVLPAPVADVVADVTVTEEPVADDDESSRDSNDDNSSSSDKEKGWEENFFDKQTLADLQQEVDDELAAKRKALKVLRKQNKSLEYTLQYTIAEYLSKLMKSKWSNQFLVKHKMTNEPSKRGASTKVPMSKREKKLLLSTTKKAWSKLESVDLDRAAPVLVGRVFNNARPKIKLN